MARSRLRRQKKAVQAEISRRMTPAQRLRRAAELTEAGRVLRRAGLSRLGFSAAEIRRIENSV